MTLPKHNRLSAKKLLLTKWTATAPRDKEKHFMVVKLITTPDPDAPVQDVELEAVHSRRIITLPWRALTDASLWRQGWH